MPICMNDIRFTKKWRTCKISVRLSRKPCGIIAQSQNLCTLYTKTVRHGAHGWARFAGNFLAENILAHVNFGNFMAVTFLIRIVFKHIQYGLKRFGCIHTSNKTKVRRTFYP